MSVKIELQNTINDMVQPGKGILAADESGPTIEKRFRAIDVVSNEESRRSYRSILLSTPGLGDAISGVILFEETLGQKDDEGIAIPVAVERAGIVVGIKVDKGLAELPGAGGERITQGLDGLGDRLQAYKAQGARFAKWRCVYSINQGTVSRRAIEANAEVLARYAACCQDIRISASFQSLSPRCSWMESMTSRPVQQSPKRFNGPFSPRCTGTRWRLSIYCSNPVWSCPEIWPRRSQPIRLEKLPLQY